ncbi:hypothetical protein GA0115259_101686 [Streptomyces sp. MnatMP-M17]|nr:hypothetical protein GA0115259_101686 [Streptomyces sp. MnatMP-M17]
MRAASTARPCDTEVDRSTTGPHTRRVAPPHGGIRHPVDPAPAPGGFSRFVSDAVEHALALTKTREIVEAYEDEHGPFSPEEIEEARRTWHGE